MSVPAWEDVPKAARIKSEDAWKLRSFDNVSAGLPVIIVAEPWCTDQPKLSHSKLLTSMLPLLKASLKEARKHATHATVALFWPHMSMPPAGEPGTAEAERRKEALQSMAALISHPFTIMMCMLLRPSSWKYSARFWTMP